jgi:hypothetical protein
MKYRIAAKITATATTITTTRTMISARLARFGGG